MSCSNLIETYTNSKYIYKGPTRWRQSFVCGQCDSCIRKQRTDWRVRAYYESLSCLRSNKFSFILFDTLTYCDDYLRKYSDIFPDMRIPVFFDSLSFSRDDVQKFFKRLRIGLSRAGYRFGRKQLRYILTSEYGTSDETLGYKNTHRPHYHILFFVTFPISPIVFSRFVSRAWHLGKTDGVRPYDSCGLCPVKKYCKGYCIYQSEEYVLNERVVSKNTTQNLIKCVNYVTKYISKDLYSTGVLKDNVERLWNYLCPGYRSDIFEYRKYRRFCSQVMPFHLQSQGFGLSLLDDDIERDYLIKTNQVHLPTGKKDVLASVALPRYYQRKLYYDFEKIDGRVVWKLNDFGVWTKLQQLDRKIVAFMRDYKAFDGTLDDSKLWQLSLYKNVYKGTLSDYASLMLPYKQYYKRLVSPHGADERPLYYNFNTFRDKLTIGSFVSTRYCLTSDGEIVYKGKQLHKEFLPFDGYVVVTDKVCPYWHGFDLKLAAFQHWRQNVGESRDVLAYQDAENVDYYKQLGLLKP